MSNHYNELMMENCYDKALEMALDYFWDIGWPGEEKYNEKVEEIYQELLDNYPEI